MRVCSLNAAPTCLPPDTAAAAGPNHMAVLTGHTHLRNTNIARRCELVADDGGASDSNDKDKVGAPLVQNKSNVVTKTVKSGLKVAGMPCESTRSEILS